MLYNPIYSQIGMQNNSRALANIPPAIKLLQAKYTRIKRTEPLQIISIVFMYKNVQ